MQSLEIVVALGTAILLGQMTATRVRLAPPIVLMLLGTAMTFLPGMHDVGLPAEIVLMLFLPILLYWDALNTSLRELRRMIRGIILNGTLLVVFTAAAVAVAAHWCGMGWGPAWIIGAAVAPTDATAVSVLGRGLTRRQTTVLKAESLINDGTALVLYALALELATGSDELTAGHAAGMFAVSFLGGIGIGLGVGWCVGQIGRRMTVPVYINVFMLLTPFIAYLLAEAIGASGVLAVVVCGLYFSRVGPRYFTARSRQVSNPFWSMSTFMLNGALFVLVGAQIPTAVGELRSDGLRHALFLTVTVWVTTLVARFVFIHVSIFLIRLIDRRPYQRTLRTTFRNRLVSVLAGFRGAVSMAVALSVPMTLADGSAFPSRDVIVVVVAGVVVLSLLVQGVIFPLAVRWAGTPDGVDDGAQDEVRRAWETAHREVLEAMPHLARQNDVSDETLGRFQEDYERKQAHWARKHRAEEDERRENQVRWEEELRFRLCLLRHERDTMVRLRDERKIDDEALHRIIQRLDIEELRLTGPAEIE